MESSKQWRSLAAASKATTVVIGAGKTTVLVFDAAARDCHWLLLSIASLMSFPTYSRIQTLA